MRIDQYFSSPRFFFFDQCRKGGRDQLLKHLNVKVDSKILRMRRHHEYITLLKGVKKIAISESITGFSS